MLKEKRVGFVGLCNGHYYELENLDSKVDGLFEMRSTSKEANGIALVSPVIKNISKPRKASSDCKR